MASRTPISRLAYESQWGAKDATAALVAETMAFDMPAVDLAMSSTSAREKHFANPYRPPQRNAFGILQNEFAFQLVRPLATVFHNGQRVPLGLTCLNAVNIYDDLTKDELVRVQRGDLWREVGQHPELDKKCARYVRRRIIVAGIVRDYNILPPTPGLPQRAAYTMFSVALQGKIGLQTAKFPMVHGRSVELIAPTVVQFVEWQRRARVDANRLDKVMLTARPWAPESAFNGAVAMFKEHELHAGPPVGPPADQPNRHDYDALFAHAVQTFLREAVDLGYHAGLAARDSSAIYTAAIPVTQDAAAAAVDVYATRLSGVIGASEDEIKGYLSQKRAPYTIIGPSQRPADPSYRLFVADDAAVPAGADQKIGRLFWARFTSLFYDSSKHLGPIVKDNMENVVGKVAHAGASGESTTWSLNM